MKSCHICIWSVLLFIGIYLPVSGQTITSIAPNSALPGDTIRVTIIGKNTNFQQGVTKLSFTNGITVLPNTIQVSQKGLCVSASVRIPSSASSGNASFIVTTNSQQVNSANSGINLTIFSEASLGSGFNANLDLMPFESISLKNINLTTPSIQPMAFMVNIYNGTSGNKFTVTVALGNHIGLIGSMSMSTGNVTPGDNLSVSNRLFTSVKVNGTNGNNFLNIVEATGDFPVDNYTYTLTVTNANGVSVSSVTSFVLSNPVATSNPELISPGAQISQNLQDVYSANPLFQWFGIYSQYDFALYFCTPGQTAEEMVRGLPVYKQAGISGNSLLYPTFAEKLIDSAEYAWQITGDVSTETGIQQVPSTVFMFRYVNLGSTGAGMKKNVTTIEISPQELTVLPGGEHQFTAICYDQDGVMIPNVKPVWELSPQGFGTISSTGLFTAGTSGGMLAVLAKADNIIQFSPVTIGQNQASAQQAQPAGDQWNMNGVMRKIFGVTNQ